MLSRLPGAACKRLPQLQADRSWQRRSVRATVCLPRQRPPPQAFRHASTSSCRRNSRTPDRQSRPPSRSVSQILPHAGVRSSSVSSLRAVDRAFHGCCNKDNRRSDAGLRCGRHRLWLRRRCRGIPPRAHGSAPGGPRAGAALAARRFSDYGQGTAQDDTADGPRAEAGRSCRALLPVGRQGADRVRRIRPRRRVADQRRRRASARSWQIAQGRLAGCGGQRWPPARRDWRGRRQCSVSRRCPARSALPSLPACAGRQKHRAVRCSCRR